jgi:hypothetical protein
VRDARALLVLVGAILLGVPAAEAWADTPGGRDAGTAESVWVLLFLLSMLVHLENRGRMALIAGTFVLVSGLVYYVFMAAWQLLLARRNLAHGPGRARRDRDRDRGRARQGLLRVSARDLAQHS